jgi:glycopeptide antibiotics resistance protein
VAVLVAFLARRRLAHWLGTSEVIGWSLIVSLGIIVAATLTPLREGAGSTVWTGPGCDLSRIGFPPWRELRSLNDTSLNILLFVPLGVALGFVPRSRRKAGMLLAASALPVVVEALQLLLTPLDRACQSADVVDNLTGLVIGLVAGSLLAALLGQDRPRPDRAGSR